MIKDNDFYTAHSHCALDTEKLGAAFALELYENPSLPKFVALYGDLGVGKTAFVRGFMSSIAPNANVKSPTFALVNEYRSGKVRVYHFDMYRISGEDDLYSIGFYDYIEGNDVCLCEWSENIEFAIPKHHISVTIEKTDVNTPDERKIEIRKI